MSGARLAGVRAADMVELAREFTSHGKKAVADIHRGVSQHTSGFYNVLAWYMVEHPHRQPRLDGRPGQGHHLNDIGNRRASPSTSASRCRQAQALGSHIIRHVRSTTRAPCLRASRPSGSGIPFATDIYQEVIPSIGDVYPYPIKALLLYMGSPVYSLPAGHTLIEILSDLQDPAVHRLGHRHRRNQHVCRLHLPGPDLPGALGILRFRTPRSPPRWRPSGSRPWPP